MPNRVSIAEAKDQLTKLVHEAERGTPAELARRGKPVAMLNLEAYEHLTGKALPFWEQLERFRQSADFANTSLDDADLNDLRERSPGRRVHW